MLQFDRPRRTREWAHGVLALVLIAGLSWLGVSPAQAADTNPTTSFAIDGDLLGPNDWGSDISGGYGPGVTPGGQPTTGTLDMGYGTDDCSDADTTRLDGKLSTDPWSRTTGAPNKKADICAAGASYEVVQVSPGEYEYIYYSFWTRSPDGTGDLTVYNHLTGPGAGYVGDVLVKFDYDPASGTTVSFLTWSGTAWVEHTVDPGVYDTAVGANVWSATGGAAGAEPGTFGEMAINLSKAGIITDDTCANFSSGDIVSQTGNSQTATMQDYIAGPPLTIATCGGISVTKQTEPANVPGTFGYTIDQADGGTVHDGTLSGDGDDSGEPDGTTSSVIGTLNPTDGDATDTWQNVIASPDYRVAETSLPTGWSTDTVVCTWSDPFTGGTARSVTLYENGQATGAVVPVLPVDIAGAGTHCVITNQTSGVVIAKAGAGDTDAEFVFTATGADDVTLKLGQTSAPLMYAPGTTVALHETAPTGGELPWTTLGVVCTDASGAVVAESDDADVSVETVAGEVITCTYTNEQQAKIIVAKDIRPDGTGATADFSGEIIASLGDGASVGKVVTPNTDTEQDVTDPYQVVEADMDGYVLAALTCDDTDSTGSVQDRTASFRVSPGEVVTCTYVNAERGSITIVKDAQPDDDTTFAFTGDLGDFTLNGDGSAASSKTFNDVAPGSHQVTETATDGWDLTAISCVDDDDGSTVSVADATATIDLDPGQSITCTFVNTAQPGQVTVTKTVDNYAGTDWSFDIALTPTPSGVTSPQAVTADAPSVTFGDLAINTTYTLSEDLPAGWTGGDISCTGITDLDAGTAGLQFQVEPGQQLECTVTNTAVSSEVTVTKSVSGVTGTDPWSFDFTIDPAPTGQDGTQTVSNTDVRIDWTDLVPGESYTITEVPVPGWNSGALVCTGVDGTDGDATDASVTFVAPLGTATGPEITCTITNPAVPGELTVTKTTTGGDGEFTFTLTPTTGDPMSAAVTTVDGKGSHTFTDLVPGMTYALTEAVTDPQLADSWIQGAITCQVTSADGQTAAVSTTALQVSPGDDIACGVTNVAKGTITIIKNVDGADSTFDFTGSWLTPPEFSITTTNSVGSVTTTNVDPGTYEVFEQQKQGYDGTQLVCTDPDQGTTVAGLRGTIDLDPGETVVCTYTNTQRALIQVIKDAQPDDDTGFAFTATGPDLDASFTLVDDGTDSRTWTSPLVAPDQAYQIAETAVLGWQFDAAASSCTNGSAFAVDGTVSVTPNPGETVVCTFVNKAKPASVTVAKTVGGVVDGYTWSFDLSLTPEGGQATSATVTNTEPVATFDNLEINTTYTLVEQLPVGWTGGEITCIGITDSDAATAGLQFQVQPGQHLFCAVTNVAETSEVEITKTVAGVGDAQEWSFDFTISPVISGQEATQAVTGTGNGTDVATWTGLVPGQSYTISEASTIGWDSGALTCTGVTDTDGDGSDASVTFVAPLGTDPGPEIACAISNTAQPGAIEVTKSSVGGDGTFGFQLVGNDGSDVTQQLTTTDGSGSVAFANLLPGVSYTLSEVDPGGHWIAGDLTCTVTHADQSVTDVAAGAITVQPGDSIACAMKNTAKGTIVVVKNVEGDDGTFDFTGDWPGTTDFPITTDGGTGSVSFTDVDPGTYTLAEVDPTPDYDGTALVCTDDDDGTSVTDLTATVDLDPGETVTCTFTNTQRAMLVVVKDAQPDDDTGFGFAATGPDLHSMFTLVDNGSDSQTWTSDLVRAGETYTIAETAMPGWDIDLEASSCSNGATFADDGSVAVVPEPGETVTCTFVNAAQPTSLTVTKTAENVPDGYAWSFPLDLSVDGSTVATQSVSGVGSDTDTVTFDDLQLNTTYTIMEGTADGWVSGSLTCTGITDLDPALAGLQFEVSAGQHLECAVTNTMGTPGITIDKSAHLDDTNGDGVGNVGETITFSFVVSNTGGVPLHDVVVNDPLLTDADVTVTCPATTLAIGESMTCTSAPLTVTESDVASGSVHNVATATGSVPETDGTPPTVTSPPDETTTPTGEVPAPPKVVPAKVPAPPLASTGGPIGSWLLIVAGLTLAVAGGGLLIARRRQL